MSGVSFLHGLFGVLVACVFMPFAARADDFNITYELNGGTAATSGMPATYTAGTAITLGTPTRVGSTFVGWCTDAELTDCAKPMTIGADATGDKTFYASWTCNNGYGAALDGQSCVADEYTVTYDCGDGSGTAPANAIATYNANFSPVMIMKNLCEKPGYVLSGWLVSGTSDVKSGTFKWTYTGDKTLTAQWVEFDPKFTITTTNMSAGDTFKYWQGSSGKFYVDWGDGTYQTINYTAVIPHTYETAGVHTIRFGGRATGHNTGASDTTPNAIGFGIRSVYKRDATTNAGTPLFVAGISGSLGDIYPSLPNDNHPRFMSTFNGCTNLTGSIPAELFRGVTGSKTDKDKNYAMFASTFENCSGLTGSIPGGLFGDLDNATTASVMFQTTFSGAVGLTGSIPENLFAGVVGIPRAGLFNATFMECSGLTGSIPENLFAGISGDASADTGSKFTVSGDTTYRDKATSAFMQTFYNCNGLTGSIPEGLFAGITGNAAYLFCATFYDCSGLTSSIPEDLFAGITDNAPHMFQSAFSGCSNLTGTIPESLFSGITGSAPYLFRGTFYNCIDLTGPIPENLFNGITGNAPHLFHGTFNGCQSIGGTIPAGLFRGITGAAEAMFHLTFQGMCAIETPIPSNLFAGVSGTAKEMFRSTFNMGRCGVVGDQGLPESGLTGYIDPQLFAGVTGNSTDIFGTTFRNTRLDAECPCGAHSVTTAWGIDKIPPTAYNPADDPTGKDVPRAVCAPGLKDGEHYYTDGNGNTVCTTDCDFATEFKTKNGENENAYPILSERVTTPALVVQSGGTQCFVPLEMGVDTFNLNWGENVYHAGRLDEAAINP